MQDWLESLGELNEAQARVAEVLAVLNMGSSMDVRPLLVRHCKQWGIEPKEQDEEHIWRKWSVRELREHLAVSALAAAEEAGYLSLSGEAGLAVASGDGSVGLAYGEVACGSRDQARLRRPARTAGARSSQEVEERVSDGRITEAIAWLETQRVDSGTAETLQLLRKLQESPGSGGRQRHYRGVAGAFKIQLSGKMGHAPGQVIEEFLIGQALEQTRELRVRAGDAAAVEELRVRAGAIASAEELPVEASSGAADLADGSADRSHGAVGPARDAAAGGLVDFGAAGPERVQSSCAAHPARADRKRGRSKGGSSPLGVPAARRPLQLSQEPQRLSSLAVRKLRLQPRDRLRDPRVRYPLLHLLRRPCACCTCRAARTRLVAAAAAA